MTMFSSLIDRALLGALFFILLTRGPLLAACIDAKVFEVEAMSEQKGTVLLDVREPYEFNDCRIPGSINIPAATLQKEYGKLDKGATIIVYCRTGRRSLESCRFLDEKGFMKVINMVGGISAWYNTGRKLEGSCEGRPDFLYDRSGKVLRRKEGAVPPEPEIKGCK